jgi:hypothetical protein
MGSGTPRLASGPVEDGFRSGAGQAAGDDTAVPFAIVQTVRRHRPCVVFTTKLARVADVWSDTTEPLSVSILVPATPGWQT